MILFLANEIGGNHGNPQANLDLYLSLLRTGKQIGIVYFSKVQTYNLISPNEFPNTRVEFSFNHWPPNIEDINELILKLSSYVIELLIANDWAFHNLMKFKVLKKLNKSSRFQTALITQTQTTNYNFRIPFEQVIERTNEYNHFITVSNNVLNEWKAAGLSTAITNCHCIPNCCDELNLNELNFLDKQDLRKKLNLASEGFISVCVASLQHRKNQNLIINNLNHLLEYSPNDLFLFVGKITDLGGTEIIENIYNSKYQDNIKFIGEVNDAKPFIRAADMLIIPSLGEVMPITIIESMALKTPVLASNVGGINELIDHLKSGLYFDLENLDSFIHNFMILRRSKTLRKSVAEKAFTKFNKSFRRSNHELNVKILLNKIMNIL